MIFLIKKYFCLEFCNLQFRYIKKCQSNRFAHYLILQRLLEDKDVNFSQRSTCLGKGQRLFMVARSGNF